MARKLPHYPSAAQIYKNFDVVEDRLTDLERMLSEIWPEMRSLRVLAHALIEGDKDSIELALAEARTFLDNPKKRLYKRTKKHPNRRIWSDDARVALFRLYVTAPPRQGARILRQYNVSRATMERWRTSVGAGTMGDARDRLLSHYTRYGARSIFAPEMEERYSQEELDEMRYEMLQEVDSLREAAKRELLHSVAIDGASSDHLLPAPQDVVHEDFHADDPPVPVPLEAGEVPEPPQVKLIESEAPTPEPTPTLDNPEDLDFSDLVDVEE